MLAVIAGVLALPDPSLSLDSNILGLGPNRFSGLEGSRLSPVDPIRGDCEGIPEVIIGAIDRDTSRPAALMHRTDACSHNM